MPLTLYVDGERWRTHLRTTAEALPGLAPVVKGNGYGLGRGRLARRAGWLGADTIAVGTYEELTDVASRFDGDLLVLSPWRPFSPDLADLDPALPRRVVHTVGRLEDLEALLVRQPAARLVLEVVTSMRRHGLEMGELPAAVDTALAGGARVDGLALHLPLPTTPGPVSHLSEVRRLLDDAAGAGLSRLGGRQRPTVWVSHLTADELATLRSSYGDVDVRPRVGTALWLGDPDALRVRATVVDVHRVARGDRYGYRGRQAPRAGHLLVVSGGTAHGIGLEAPTGNPSLRSRAATVARGGLDALGLVRSPFTVDGKPRLFAEPPHMQVSMLFVPDGARVPAVGDELPVRVRHTTTAFDAVVVS